MSTKTLVRLNQATIRIVGDSGDGVQTAGNYFTNTSALMGNDVCTLPVFPAEIRAPAGTLAGVSSFQLHFGDHEIFTPGDQCDTLVAFNPAALKVGLRWLKQGGNLIIDVGSFKEKTLEQAGYETNPLEDNSLEGYNVFTTNITKLTRDSVEGLGLSTKEADRCKNFFSLGIVYWLYNRSLDHTIKDIQKKFSKKANICEANIRALKGGHVYAENADIFPQTFHVPRATLAPGRYRNLTGNAALVLGMVTAGQKSGLRVFLGSYPITPASDVLHQLSRYKHMNVCTFQAEDEIAAICSSIGAAYSGALAFTTTSGPGMCLKAEAMGLAVSTELPLVICDVQRAGPSTGMPTNTEQSDLSIALFGRHGESPIPVLAARSPSDCFDTVLECARIALRYMTPVIFLSDGYLANSAEPWNIPRAADIPPIPVSFAEKPRNGQPFQPFLRKEDTLARHWALPGTPGLEHRIGGLEKEDVTGNVSYSPKNHQRMTELRAEKIQRITEMIPKTEIDGPEEGELLFVGWGGTYGAIRTAAQRLRKEGRAVAHVHLRHLRPLPPDLGEILTKYKRIIVPELNMGQLLHELRATYQIPMAGLNKVEGLPFSIQEIVDAAGPLVEKAQAEKPQKTPEKQPVGG